MTNTKFLLIFSGIDDDDFLFPDEFLTSQYDLHGPDFEGRLEGTLEEIGTGLIEIASGIRGPFGSPLSERSHASNARDFMLKLGNALKNRGDEVERDSRRNTFWNWLHEGGNREIEVELIKL